MRTGVLFPALTVVVLVGCGPVHHTLLRSDYDQIDARQTVRIVVTTTPLPEGNKAEGQLWSELARHYANDHRDFLVKSAVSGTADLPSLCTDNIQGVLKLEPTVREDGDSVQEAVHASLLRCRDGGLVWEALADGRWKSADPNVGDVTDHYVQLLGTDVRPFVAPTYHLLKGTLDALPHPVLDEQEKDEKIDMNE